MTGRLALSFRHCQARQRFVTIEINTLHKMRDASNLLQRVADRQRVPTTMHHQGLEFQGALKSTSKEGLSPWRSKQLQSREEIPPNQIKFYQLAPLSVPRNTERNQFFGVPTSQCLHWLGTPKNWGRRVATGQVLQALSSPYCLFVDKLSGLYTR